MNRYVIPLFLMILSAAVYIKYIDVTYVKFTQQLAKEKEIKDFLAQAVDARTKLDDLESQYKAFPENTDSKLNVLLPEKIDQLKLIIDVNNIAKRHGLEIVGPAVTVVDLNPKSAEKYAKYSLRFKITASYPLFRNFLKDVERSLALRDFGAVTFTSAPDVGTSAVVRPEIALFDYNVELTSYALH